MFEKLTKMETNVVKLMARGLTTKQIAENYTVSEATIKTHVGNLYDKLLFENPKGEVCLSELIQWAKEAEY